MSIPIPENLEHLIDFTPEAQADVLQKQMDRQQFKSEYLNTIDQLQTIENTDNPTQVNLATLVQMAGAIKFIAKSLRLLIKLIARSF